MAEGKNPLSLPPYSHQAPVEYSARCPCGARYLIFNPNAPGIVGDAESRAKERAEAMGRTFVNSLLSPFVLCRCGKALDFSQAESSERLM
jgi:hypothetical protein